MENNFYHSQPTGCTKSGDSYAYENTNWKDLLTNYNGQAITYDAIGNHTSKTVDGVTTNYFLDGSTILAQKTGNNFLWFCIANNGNAALFFNVKIFSAS